MPLKELQKDCREMEADAGIGQEYGRWCDNHNMGIKALQTYTLCRIFACLRDDHTSQQLKIQPPAVPFTAASYFVGEDVLNSIEYMHKMILLHMFSALLCTTSETGHGLVRKAVVPNGTAMAALYGTSIHGHILGLLRQKDRNPFGN